MGLKDSIRERTYESLTGVISRLLADRLGAAGSLLDIGCGDGGKTLVWAEALSVPPERVAGVEAFPTYLERARGRFDALPADIEHDPLPFPDASFDLVVANQIFEHVKNVFHLMGEACRVTKPGGHLLVSTPNLASLHNRLLLLLGRQPTPIKVFCEHVRGFTPGALRDLAEASGDMELAAESGGGFYPFPPGVGNPLGRAWPGGAVYCVLLFKRVREADPSFWSRWAEGTQDTRWVSG